MKKKTIVKKSLNIHTYKHTYILTHTNHVQFFSSKPKTKYQEKRRGLCHKEAASTPRKSKLTVPSQRSRRQDLETSVECRRDGLADENYVPE